MKNPNKKMFSIGIIIFIDYISVFLLFIFITTTENFGEFPNFFPLLFLIPIILSIVAIVKSTAAKSNNMDEKVGDLGPLGPKPQIFKSVSSEVLFQAVMLLIFGIIGFIFFMYFHSFFN